MAVKPKSIGVGEIIFPIPKYTTDERNALDLDEENAYMIYNTTTVQLEYTVDGGSTWLAV